MIRKGEGVGLRGGGVTILGAEKLMSPEDSEKTTHDLESQIMYPP